MKLISNKPENKKLETRLLDFVFWILGSMLKDWNHDLVHALSEKNDALWRYGRHYKKASEDCQSCTALWAALEADDEKHVKLIAGEIERHIKEGRFD